MLVTSRLNINMQQPSPRSVIYAVQNDSSTRAVELCLFEGDRSWVIPSGTTAAVGFKKPDGTSGLYDTLPDGTPAIRIQGNMVTAILAPQVLTQHGRVDMSVVLHDAKLGRLGVFPFPVFVSADPCDNEVVSEDYYWLSTLAAIGDLSSLKTVAKDSLVAAINELFDAKGVLSVNGIKPDDDGNVNINADNIFIAEYGVTALDEVSRAYLAGKLCLTESHLGDRVVPLIGFYEGHYALFGVQNNGEYVTYTVNADGWDVDVTRYNKVYNMSEYSTDDDIPTAKAVWDLFQSMDEAAAIEDLAEAGVVDPVADGNNGVFVDENDRVYTF